MKINQLKKKISITHQKDTNALPKNTIWKEVIAAKAVVAIVPMDLIKKQVQLENRI